MQTTRWRRSLSSPKGRGRCLRRLRAELNAAHVKAKEYKKAASGRRHALNLAVECQNSAVLKLPELLRTAVQEMDRYAVESPYTECFGVQTI